MPVDQGRAPAQLADLGEEFARPLACDRHHMAQAVALRDGDHALEQHEHAGAGLAGGEQALAARKALHAAEAGDACHLGVTEDGESLVQAAVGAWCVGGHGVELRVANAPH
ncbi:hypothetical protein D3C72_2010220 [compost metagenome]